MKPFIASIYALFLFAMISGVVTAYRNSEGLVEKDYYRKQNDWFMNKTMERRLGLEIGKPESLALGSNRMRVTLSEHGQPLRNAEVHLFIGNVSNSKLDFSCPMREAGPGIYQADAVVPSKGKWLVRIELAANQLNTSRSWFYDVN
jgi:hypothetical protein